MSVTLDAALGTGKGHSTASFTITTTSAVSPGGCVVVGCAMFRGGGTDFSVSGGSVTWNSGMAAVTSGQLLIRIFYAFAPSGIASGTVLTVTAVSGGSNDLMGAAISFLGVNTTTPTNASSGSGATATAWSSGNVLASSGDALVGFCFEDGSATATSSPTSPAVEFADFNDATQTEAFTGAYKLTVAGTDAIAGTWSTSVTHIRAAMNLRPAAGAVTTAPVSSRRFPQALLIR